MRHSTVGMSVVELVVSLALFSVLMAAVLEAMANTTNYVEFDATRTDLQTESLNFQTEVTNDLANAGWFYKYDPATSRYVKDSNDEKIPFYPLVGSSNSTLEFLKLRTSLSVQTSPADLRYSQLDFRKSATPPVKFSEFVDSRPTPLLVMNTKYSADPDLYIASVWESWPSSSSGSRSFDDNLDPKKLRHYLYCIETDAGGRKNLVRKYLNGHNSVPPAMPAISTWNLDVILLRDVESVQFSTTTQDANLNENQIRIQVTMRRSSARSAITGVKVSRVLDFTAAMRSMEQQ